MKVVHYIHSIDKKAGGTATFLQLLANNISNDIKISIATGVCFNPINIPNASVKYFSLELKNWFTLKRAFSTYLKMVKPDLVHINGIWTPQNWLFQKESQKLGIEVILSPHGMLEPYILKRNSLKKKLALFLYQNKAIKKVNYLHSTANSEFKQIRKLGYKQLNTIIPNGINIADIKTKQAFFNAEFKNILFLSRVHPKKGIELLIDAVSELNSQNVNVVIAGEGNENYIESLKKLVKVKGVEKQFSFVGGVYGKKKEELFNQADVFVLPTYSENFGIVVVEALAANIPVITTKGTPWEELNLNNCGWWIDLSVNNLKDSLETVISMRPDELKQMGARGRSLVEENYDIKKVTHKMIEFYHWIYDDTKIKPNFVKD